MLANRKDGVLSARVVRPAVAVAAASTDVETSETALKDADGKDISGAGIRRRFLEFYESRGHARLPSSSQVPEDPTVLLTIAGMLQFKPVFMGQEELKVPCATTTQKCVRTNDIENVGVTARHHTFFEMLGNFSFGDYFKKEAIQWAWELATKEYGLDASRVWVSVFRRTTRRTTSGKTSWAFPRNASSAWTRRTTTGPWPITAVRPVLRAVLGLPSRARHGLACDLDDDSRFIEFYNLVFMECPRAADGTTTPLARKNIDTGMGLCAATAGQAEQLRTHLDPPIIDKAASMAGMTYASASDAEKLKLKVIETTCAPCRTSSPTACTPPTSEEGTCAPPDPPRRAVRRASRRRRAPRRSRPRSPRSRSRWATRVTPSSRAAPRRCSTSSSARSWRFATTLGRGEEILVDMLAAAVAADAKAPVLSGDDAFTLYDTYGFPLTSPPTSLARRASPWTSPGSRPRWKPPRNLSRDARVAVDVTAGDLLAGVADELGEPTRFTGYGSLAESDVRVRAIVKQGARVDEASPGDAIDVVLDATPFYAEGGGQIGDEGEIVVAGGATLAVNDCRKAAGGRLFVHSCEVVGDAPVREGDAVTAAVNAASRRRAKANHTATHLLQSALKLVVGEDGPYRKPARW